MKISTLIIYFLLAFVACGQKNYNKQDFQSIVFGMYCGECRKDCTTMYRLSWTDGKRTLEMDTTDSFFKNNGEIKFNKVITDKDLIELATNIQSKIPNSFLTTTKQSEKFGCPDCTDGCGIYFELKKDSIMSKFYIDTDTSNLDNDVKVFAIYLMETLNNFEK